MSASGSALAQLKPFTLSPRSLFIRCIPTPTSFFERRAVFAALQRSSQQSIETFKRLQDSSSFIAVATNPDAAANLLSNSPLKEVLLSHDPSGSEASISAAWRASADVSGSIANPVHLLQTGSTVPEPTPSYTSLGLSHKAFTIHIFQANETYNHRVEIEKNPLHGQWPGHDKPETFMSAALKRVVPSGAMAPALRDWDEGNQLARDSDSFADDSQEGAAARLLGKTFYSPHKVFIMERIRRRSAVKRTPEIMSSPIRFAKECRAKSAPSAADTSSPSSSSSIFESASSKAQPQPSSSRTSESQSDADDPFLES